MNFDKHIIGVFEELGTSYDEVKALMMDLYTGDIEEGTSKKEAEESLRNITRKIFGLDEKSTKRDRARAYREHGRQFFDVIEEIVDSTVTTGLREDEWFNAMVNYHNLAEGDENLFVNKHEDVILSVAKMGKRHHDTILQRLPEDTTYQIATDVYGAAVGADIDRYLIGQEDWASLVDAITRAFIDLVQNLIFTEIYSAYQQIPVQTGFVDSGALNTTNRKAFNKVLQNVSVANGNAEVVIVGTMVGLQMLEGLIDVNWIAQSQKEAKAANSRLGNYGRYQLVEIPQKFAKNDVTRDMYNDNILFVFAVGDQKLVDMVDVGETIIDEVTERGEANGRIDDVMKYEVQRELGVGVRLGRYFGQWTITED